MPLVRIAKQCRRLSLLRDQNEAQLLAHWNVLHENLTATEEVNEQLRKPSPAIAIPWTPKRKSAYQHCVNDPTVQSRNELIMECNGHQLFAALAELECRADRLDQDIARIDPVPGRHLELTIFLTLVKENKALKMGCDLHQLAYLSLSKHWTRTANDFMDMKDCTQSLQHLKEAVE